MRYLLRRVVWFIKKNLGDLKPWRAPRVYPRFGYEGGEQVLWNGKIYVILHGEPNVRIAHMHKWGYCLYDGIDSQGKYASVPNWDCERLQ